MATVEMKTAILSVLEMYLPGGPCLTYLSFGFDSGTQRPPRKPKPSPKIFTSLADFHSFSSP